MERRKIIFLHREKARGLGTRQMVRIWMLIYQEEMVIELNLGSPFLKERSRKSSLFV